MNHAPHREADRELDVETVRSALSDAFPEFELGAVQPLGSGSDFDTFGIDLRWIARFPRHEAAVHALEAEARVMPQLAVALRELGIEVPEIHGVGAPSTVFSRPFLVQRRIWGLPLESVGPSRFAIRLAPHLGQALSTVHQLAPPDGPELERAMLGRPMGDNGEWLTRARAAASEMSAELRGRVAVAVDWVEGDPEVPDGYTGAPRLLHNDLWPHHVRVARTGLGVIGIFDWSDVALGDPARDFALLYSWGGPAILQAMLPGYSLEMDGGFAERVRFMARVGSIGRLCEIEAADADLESGDLAKYVVWTLNAFASEEH